MTGTYGVAIFDGEVVNLRDLRLTTFSDGYFYGCGLFETMALEEGRPQFLERHLARLGRSLAALPAVKSPRAELLDLDSFLSTLSVALWRVGQTVGKSPSVVKVTSSDGHVLVTFRDSPPELPQWQAQGVGVDVVDYGSYRSGDVYVNHKTTSYIKSYSGIAASTLFANECGEICESSTANVFVRFSDRVVTPPLRSPCLPGIVREVLLEAGTLGGVPVVEEALPLEALRHAEGCFLTNSVSVAIPVTSLLNRALIESGPLAASARQRISRIERLESSCLSHVARKPAS